MATVTRSAPAASNVRRVNTLLFSSSFRAYRVICRIRSAPTRLDSALSFARRSSLSRSSTAAGDEPLGADSPTLSACAAVASSRSSTSGDSMSTGNCPWLFRARQHGRHPSPTTWNTASTSPGSYRAT